MRMRRGAAGFLQAAHYRPVTEVHVLGSAARSARVRWAKRAIPSRIWSAVFRPHEGPGVLVVGCDEVADPPLPFADRTARTAFDLSIRQEREPALDLVDPGTAGRREVHMEAAPLGEPVPYERGFVRPAVVHDRMDIQALRDRSLDGLEATPRGAASDGIAAPLTGSRREGVTADGKDRGGLDAVHPPEGIPVSGSSGSLWRWRISSTSSMDSQNSPNKLGSKCFPMPSFMMDWDFSTLKAGL